ncbi:hypothetical protein [Variovorax boronicumulans]|uniref:hypothetical protein n=1 Tax=Variovorax boronicumulans TaxID=436515 RepID=UPI00085CD93E|nr:hypothetical protein [Variovorax boronicumulans]OEZ31027.1 hypothetical protein AO062_09735 [Variovorax boronicumulans]
MSPRRAAAFALTVPLLASTGHAASRFDPPPTLELAKVEYQLATPQPQTLADGRLSWVYKISEGDEGGAWVTALTLFLRPGPVSDADAELKALSARFKGERGRKQHFAGRTAQGHAYWYHLVEIRRDEQFARAFAHKSFHEPACGGVLTYQFSVLYPMKWTPKDTLVPGMLDAITIENERALAALERDRWQPDCR